MCCHLGSGSLVDRGTSQSLVTRFWVPVLRNLKVISSFSCICFVVFFFVCFIFIKYYGTFFIVTCCSAVIVLVDFTMYIVSYNSEQNGSVYFISL